MLLYQSINKCERSRAKNRDERRDGQREQLQWQLRLVIRVSKRSGTHSLRGHDCGNEQFIAGNNCATTTNIYRLLVIERYVIPGGHMEMFIARPIVNS